jgi:hypothetical protein
MPKHKRSRGGQPGNQNARKHGFYSRQLSAQESCEYLNIINTTGISPESAVLRLKMQSVFRRAPANYPLLRDIAKMIVKNTTAQVGMGPRETRLLKRVTRRLVKALAAATASGDKKLIERIVAESLKIPENSNNESTLDQLID